MERKRLTFIFAAMVACFLFLGGLSANAQINGIQIEFGVAGIDDTPIVPGYGKGPVLMPTVWQDGYLLDFNGTHDDYVLRLVDATNTVVYSTVVPSYLTQVWLPTYLLGAYRIELLTDELLFYGYITL